ncbi:MAG: hypothetical protein AB8H80_00715 [Planctomycetota bacterium]
MTHIALAAPGLDRFQLHFRLRRELLRKGHRITIICLDAADATFWRQQVDEKEVAAFSHLGIHAAATRWCEQDLPDLLVLHRDRRRIAREFAATVRSFGARVLWTGDGLLPHTMQCDERGLDADAGCLQFGAADYRCVAPDRDLIAASLAHALAAPWPTTLPASPITKPALRQRLVDAARSLLTANPRRALRDLNGWREAEGGALPIDAQTKRLTADELPQPCVAVLLQAPEDPRLALDGKPSSRAKPESATELMAAACRLAEAIGTRLGVTCGVVAIPAAAARNTATDEANALRRLKAQLRQQRLAAVRIVARRHAAQVAATAACVVTVNDPAAVTALLAGTPIVHTGRALFALPGLTTRIARAREIAASAEFCLQRDRPALRRRFLTWLFRHGHVWCSPDAPHYNGMLGLVEAIERRLVAPPGEHPLRPGYLPGPAWPLATARSAR